MLRRGRGPIPEAGAGELGEIAGSRLLGRIEGRIACLDSVVLIYFLEDDERYVELLDPLFREWERGNERAIASTLAITEIVAGPLRLGAGNRAREMIRYLRAYQGLEFHPIDADIAFRAGELRATPGLATPDALHAATALIGDAEIFLTNDRAFRPVEGFETILLDDFRESP